MSAASFDQNYLEFLQDPRTQRSIKARGEDPGKILMEETLRQQGIGPSSIFGGLGGSTPGIVPEPDRRYGDRFGRTPGIVPEFEYNLTDVNRGQQMQDSVKQFYDSLDAPGIRNRVDAFLGGLAGGPSFDITPGGDQRRARKGLSSEDVKRLIDANPDFGGQIEGMYLPGPKATPFFKKA